MKDIFKDIFNLFYPKICLVCENFLTNDEHILCISCKSEIPVTNFHIMKENAVEISFYGRVPIEAATSLLFFSKRGIVQKLIHQLKYKNQQQIGTYLGEWMGDEINENNRFENIDCIVPVPLHPKRFKKRGYNQVITFGKSLSERLKVPLYDDVLLRVSRSNTQTFKKRKDRWDNVVEKFVLSSNKTFQNKHILLIDDIITTGATLESCCLELLKTNNIRISVATMAYTK